ncbi:MAG: hypothetical protein ACI4Q8_06340 [Ruminococcus sp.]
MATDKMKCTECGYVFEGDIDVENSTCPLCSRKYNTKSALEYYKQTNNSKDNAPKKVSKHKKVWDWIITGVSFIGFIIILYFIISYIVNV